MTDDSAPPDDDGATLKVHAATPDDAAAIADIYNHYIAHTVVTFEEVTVAAAEMARRLAEIQGASLPWLMAVEDGQPVGYAYAAPWRARSAYRYSVETTVYLDHRATGRGVGVRLYDALFENLRSHGLHCAIGGITLPNAASVALHEKCGFVKTGHFREVGFKFDRWLDVGYWQKLF